MSETPAKKEKDLGSDLIALHLTIDGKVQGVFYRSSMKRMADDLQIRGWVRNLDDGRVEAVIQGTTDAIDHIIKWCKVGPTNSVVADLRSEEIKVQGDLRNFSVVY
jgi:acylphosphatase